MQYLVVNLNILFYYYRVIRASPAAVSGFDLSLGDPFLFLG